MGRITAFNFYLFTNKGEKTAKGTVVCRENFKIYNCVVGDLCLLFTTYLLPTFRTIQPLQQVLTFIPKLYFIHIHIHIHVYMEKKNCD